MVDEPTMTVVCLSAFGHIRNVCWQVWVAFVKSRKMELRVRMRWDDGGRTASYGCRWKGDWRSRQAEEGRESVRIRQVDNDEAGRQDTVKVPLYKRESRVMIDNRGESGETGDKK